MLVKFWLSQSSKENKVENTKNRNISDIIVLNDLIIKKIQYTSFMGTQKLKIHGEH